MSWQCSRDGSMNTGWRCDACGGPPYSAVLVLRGADKVFRVTERSRIIGRRDWEALGGKGISSDHLRCFYSLDDGAWNLASVTATGKTWVNGVPLEPGSRLVAQHGDNVQLGTQVFLTVELHSLTSR